MSPKPNPTEPSAHARLGSGATDGAPGGSADGVHGKGALALFGKAPIPGQVKTRLCPPLTAAEAAGLYRGFLRDICRSPAPDGIQPFLYGWPGDQLESLRDLVPGDLSVRPQSGADLWGRMAHCMAQLFGEGYGPVGIRNTDSPALPLERMEEGFAKAGPGRVVLGPDPGGGYYLIVLGEDCPELLAPYEVPADQVLAATVARAESLGLGVELLPEEPDIDTYADLLAHWGRRREPGS